jgi:hypothetical protein
MKKFSFTKMWFETIFLSGSLAVFEERGEPACGRAANHGGLFSPPAAAKNVRTIFNIVHTLGLVNFSASPLRGSAAKLNGIFQSKDNFWFCLRLRRK